MRILKPIVVDLDQRCLIAKDLGSTNHFATKDEVTSWLYKLVNGTLATLSKRHSGKAGAV
jgi:hypothetical protein